MTAKEGGRTFKKGRVAAATALFAAGTYLAADIRYDGPVTDVYQTIDASVSGEITKSDAYPRFLGIVEKYTTAAPHVQATVQGLSQQQFSEQFKVAVITDPEKTATTYTFTTPGLPRVEGNLPLEALYPSLSVTETHKPQLWRDKTVTRIEAYVGKGGIVQTRDSQNPDAVIPLSPDTMRERAAGFTTHPEFANPDGWNDVPQKDPAEPRQIAKVVKDENATFELVISESGKVNLRVRE